MRRFFSHWVALRLCHTWFALCVLDAASAAGSFIFKRCSMQRVRRACILTLATFVGRVREINREDRAHSMEQLLKAGASCRTVSMGSNKRQQHQMHESAFHSHTCSVLQLFLWHESCMRLACYMYFRRIKSTWITRQRSYAVDFRADDLPIKPMNVKMERRMHCVPLL